MKKLLVLLTTALLFAGCSATEPASKDAEQTTDVVSEAEQTNADENKKAILVVSFGTSYKETREKTIDAIEKEIRDAYSKDYEVRRAFTSQTIIDIMEERDKIETDNVTEAMDKLVAEGFGTLIVQPTHIMNGFEYDEMVELIKPYEDKFVSVKYGTPLLTSSDDYFNSIDAIMAENTVNKDEAIVFMGHGTHHYANATYAALDYMFKEKGYSNVYIGTVEGYPDLDTVIKKVKKDGYTKVKLLPFMIVAGDHASNDMAGDEEDSWKSIFEKEGFEVSSELKGLGEYDAIRDIYVKHIENTINSEEK